MSEFLLRQDVYLACPQGTAILLDLTGNQYVGLSPAQTCALQGLVSGWPEDAPPVGTGLPGTPKEAEEFARSLVQRGLLTCDLASGKAAVPLVLKEIRAPIWNGERPIRPPDVWHQWCNFARAFARARRLVRTRSTGEILKAVEMRKARARTCQRHSDCHLAGLVHAFVCLRPFFYTWRDRCLFDSLVLVDFLAHYDVFPLWVFGVKTNPFAAHSWVQDEHYVLNGAPEDVKDFAPIIAV